MPIVPDEEIEQLPEFDLTAPPVEAAPVVPAPVVATPAPPDPYEYIRKKYEAELADQGRRNQGSLVFQGLAGLGDAIAGRNPMDSAARFDAMRQNALTGLKADYARRMGEARQTKQDTEHADDRAFKRKVDEGDLARKGIVQKREDEKYERDQAVIAQRRDKTSPVSALYQRLAKQMDPQGQDYSSYSADEIEEMVPLTAKLRELIERREDRNEARKYRQDMLDATRGEKQAKADEKREEKESKRVIGGFELAEGEPELTNEQRGKFSTREGDTRVLAGAVDDALDAIKANGGNLVGPKANTISQAITRIHLKIKNTEGLGVLSAGDMQILETLQSDPTEYFNFLKEKVGARDFAQTLLTLKKYAHSDLVRNAQALGLRPRAGKGFDSAPPADNRPRRTVNGETRVWDGSKWVKE
jgi:hypothetical protein